MNKKLNFIIFNLLIFILFLNFYLGIHGINSFQIYCKIFFLFFSCIYFFRNYRRVSKREIKLLIILSILAIYFKEYYLCSVVIILSKNISKNKRLKIVFFWSLIFLLTNIFLDQFCLIETIGIIQRKYGGILKTRYLLGFNGPNMALMMMMPILFIFYYISDTTKVISKLKVLGIIFIASYILFRLTYSRSGFILVLLFIMISFIKDKYIKNLKVLIQSEVFLILSITLFFSEKLKNTIFNEILSGRPFLYDYYLKNIQINFLSWQGKDILVDGLPLDNNYLRILLGYGYFGLILVVVIVFYIFRILFQNNDYKGIRILSIILIYCYTEGIVFGVLINIIYFIIFEYLVYLKNKKILKVISE